MGISICIPTYNRLPQLKCLLDSIFSGFDDYPYEVTIADGGSTDGTIEYLKTLDNVTLLEMGELTGSIKAFNACFKVARYEYVFFPSDDMVIEPNIVIKACRLMDDYKEIVLVAPKIQEPVYNNLPGVELPGNCLVLSKVHIFRASVLREINYFDENLRTYGADDDSCFSVLKLGYTMIFTKEVGIIHNRAKDELGILNQNIETDKRQAEYFRQKWASLNSKIDEYTNSSLITKYRRYKSKFCLLICGVMSDRKLFRPLVERFHTLAERFYDYFLRQCVVFKAKEYDHLKDFYLAQRLSEEVISTPKVVSPLFQLQNTALK